ncbi:MAG: hypothetical protein IPN38_20210 [Flavobacteriales bacterium]|nr:hypothetical protein [Flavobacteriales bacterium]
MAIAGSGDVQADSVFGAGARTLLRVAGSGGMRASGRSEKRPSFTSKAARCGELAGTTTDFDAQVQGSGNIMADC